jgi:uncharacterized protein DUF4154
MKIKKYIILLITAITLVGSSSFMLSQSDTQEYILKAAFLYRFTDYVDWGNTNGGDDFTIAVLGKSEITPPLIEIAKEKKAQGKRIIIKEYDDVNDISSCQVVFVSNNYKADIESVVAKLGDKPILLIAEQPDACAKGADINFQLSDNKLKFEININAAAGAGLKISSQLLQHAILVNTP